MAKHLPRAIQTIDQDTIAIVLAFRELKKYATNSEALEKLLQRAKELDLHKLNDADFEQLSAEAYIPRR